MQQTDVTRNLRLLTPAQFRDAWPLLRSILKPVEDQCHGELTLDDIPKLVDDRKAFILEMIEGDEVILVGVMEIVVFPRKTTMNTIMMAGRGSKHLFTDCRHQVAAIAQALGASCIRGFVRPSVSRLLRQSTPRAREIYSVVEIDL